MSEGEERAERIQEELMKEHPILDMVSFNDMNIQEKLKINSYQVAQYSNLLSASKREYELLEEKYNALLGMQYDHYKFEMDKELTKVEIERYYLPQDKKVRQMKRILDDQRVRIDFFESCVRGLKQVGWNMKTFMEAEKVLL
jgi:hypothetical protein